jgi:hypothetical protein
MIYFVQVKPDGLIKIGTTIRLSVRLAQLQIEHGAKFTVLGILDGSYADESALHRQFLSLRQQGEWFDPAPELLTFIADETRPWDGRDERPTVTTKIDPELLRKAQQIVAFLPPGEDGKPPKLSEYLDTLLRATIERDHVKLLKRLSKEQHPDANA